MRVHVRHQQREVRGSTIFAVLMNWNTLFSLFVFIPAIWINFIKKVNDPVWPLSEVGRIWYGSVLVLWNCCELPRLYLGITGNKDHLIAPLLLFAVITFFIDLVVMVVFNFISPHGNALDKGITSIQILFAVSELVFCSTIFSRMAHQNTVDYYAHVWGQERYNQSLIQRKKKDEGESAAYDDDDNGDDFYHNNENNDPDAPINANAPQRVFPHQKGNLGNIDDSNRRKKPSSRGKSNNNFSDYEMDSMEEDDDDDDQDSSSDDDSSDYDGNQGTTRRRKQSQPYSNQCLASERNADRDYTPAKGSREFLALAPPLSASNSFYKQNNNDTRNFDDVTSNNSNANFRQRRKEQQDRKGNLDHVRTESPSRLLRSPSGRRGITVNTLRDSQAFTDGALFATANSKQEAVSDNGGGGTDKKRRKSSSSRKGKTNEGGIAPPLSDTGDVKKKKKKKVEDDEM